MAGLSAAFRVREEMRSAGQGGEVVVFEREPRCGGATRTERVDGLTLDRGPNGWLSSEPLTERLVGELGLAAELIPSNDAARKRFVYTRGKLHMLPASPPRFITSRLLGPIEKLRVLGELAIPGRKDDGDESIYDFGRRRLGAGFAETLLDPMVSGIFAGDVRKLSLPATFPKMRDMELTYGGLFRAMLGKRREAKRAGKESGSPAGPAGVLTTLRGGVGRFTDALRDSLASEVREGIAVLALERDGNGFALRLDGGERERFDAVVMAPPAHSAAEIVAELSPRASRAIGEIGFANVAVVCSVYDPEQLGRELDGFGHLIPRRDGIRSLGCLWTSSIFPQQTNGEVLLRTILGGATDQAILELDDDALRETVRADMSATLGVDAVPARSWVFRHPRGIAQYNLGHRERVAEAERLCAELPGLAFVGASYRGVALNRCVRDAYTIAPRVLEPFGVRPPRIPDGEAFPSGA